MKLYSPTHVFDLFLVALRLCPLAEANTLAQVDSLHIGVDGGSSGEGMDSTTLLQSGVHTMEAMPHNSDNNQNPLVHHDFGNHISISKCNEPLYNWFQKTFQTSQASEFKLLDVGGGEGQESAKLQQMDKRLNAECIDVVASKRCKEFDGLSLAGHPDKSKDFAMFVYMLHHAASSAIPLLIEAKRVAKQLVIMESMKGDTEEGLASEFHHPGCKLKGGCQFRSANEWKSLFKLADLRVVFESNAARDCTGPHDHYKVPRMFWVLEADE